MPSQTRPKRCARALCALALCIASSTTACVDPSTPPPEAPTAPRAQEVVYGEDDRLDVYAHPDASLRQLAQRSVVALMETDDLGVDDQGNVFVFGETLGEAKGLCSDQRFYDQIAGSSCSGTLIDDDLVLTAGHCMPNQAECDIHYAMFGFYMSDADTLNQSTLDDLYACDRLLVHFDDDVQDYAIFQLDRPVTGPREPAVVRTGDRAMELGEAVTLMGFPSRIPLKIATGGNVTRPRASSRDYFEATVDAFGGNSGSGVFGPDNDLVGILVRGETDYVDRGNCQVVNVLPQDGAGGGEAEDITYVARAIEALCATGFPSARLCAGDGGLTWCFPCGEDADCAEGFTCAAWSDAPDVTTCAPSCATQADCRADHVCQGGTCLPRRSAECAQARPVEVSACGSVLVDNGACSGDAVCVAGACVERNDTCASATLLEPVSQSVQGDLVGFTNARQGSCAGLGPDAMFTFTLETSSSLRATALGYDSVLHLRTVCDAFDTEIACNDDPSDNDRQARIELDLEPGTYTLILDAYDSDTDDYTLELEFEAFCDDTLCAEGETRCDGEDRVATCALDAQGCPFWGAATPCAADAVCSAGACVSPGAGDTCDAPVVLEPVTQTLEDALDPQRFQGDLVGSCAGEGPDRVYQLDLDTPARVEATAFGYDTVLHLRSDCLDADSEVICNDDSEPPGDFGSRIEAELEAGTWFVILDAYDTTTGDYTLELVVEPLVTCDDDCAAPGETRCAQLGVQTCVERDGCLVWDQPTPCAEGEACDDGACVTLCDSNCSAEGDVRCTDDGEAQTCDAAPDAPDCLRWSAPVACGEDAVCVPDAGCQAIEPPEDAGETDVDMPDTDSPDTATPDATPDAEADVAPDAAPDVPLDAEPDAEPDAAPDATPTPDTSIDANPTKDDQAPPVIVGNTSSGDGCGCATPSAPTPALPPGLGIMVVLGLVTMTRRRARTTR